MRAPALPRFLALYCPFILAPAALPAIIGVPGNNCCLPRARIRQLELEALVEEIQSENGKFGIFARIAGMYTSVVGCP